MVCTLPPWRSVCAQVVSVYIDDKPTPVEASVYGQKLDLHVPNEVAIIVDSQEHHPAVATILIAVARTVIPIFR